MYPKKETLRVGSLHPGIASQLPQTIPREVQRILVLNDLVFSKDSLPPPDSRTQAVGSKYVFKEVAVEDLDDVVETSTVMRIKASLAAASSTGAYLASSEDMRAQAWCFISREGAVSSVYVRPEARGMGLGKETMRKELEKGFVFKTHVSPTNTASLRLCQSLGAHKTSSNVIWVEPIQGQLNTELLFTNYPSRSIRWRFD
jgi:GNAT superfamily N-acetyltransferase